MYIKRVRAQTAAEAMMRIRAELGAEAMILESRRVRRRGWIWPFWLPFWEYQVTAAIDVDAAPAPAARPAVAAATEVLRKVAAAPPLQTAADDDALRRELLAPRGSVHARGASASVALPAAAPPRPLEPNPEPPSEAVLAPVKFAPWSLDPGARKAAVLAVVGPTGVGKTTTLAKLAARFALTGLDVRLITADTYRVGAVAQLETYAELLGIELAVAATPAALARQLERWRESQVILVDTSGRSHRDERRLDELAGFLRAMPEAILHLVLPAGLGRRDAEAIGARYLPLGVSRLIITKLDETEERELPLWAARTWGLPLAYLSGGQDVPDDLDEASWERLQGWLEGGDDHAAGRTAL